VSFKAIGRPSALKIHGKGDAPKGAITVEGGKVTGKSTFDLTSLDTGIKLRNTHMKEKYLETEKYPQATLTITEMAAPEGFDKPDFKADDLPFKGAMALHGVERPVEGEARLERKGDSMEVETDFSLKTSEFNIPTPSFAGITLAETIDVNVKITAPFRIDQ
jgi:polyisoprenoid-binding protein YceI